MLWHLKEYNGISMHKIIKIASPIGLSQYFCKKKKKHCDDMVLQEIP